LATVRICGSHRRETIAPYRVYYSEIIAGAHAVLNLRTELESNQRTNSKGACTLFSWGKRIEKLNITKLKKERLLINWFSTIKLNITFYFRNTENSSNL